MRSKTCLLIVAFCLQISMLRSDMATQKFMDVPFGDAIQTLKNSEKTLTTTLEGGVNLAMERLKEAMRLSALYGEESPYNMSPQTQTCREQKTNTINDAQTLMGSIKVRCLDERLSAAKTLLAETWQIAMQLSEIRARMASCRDRILLMAICVGENMFSYAKEAIKAPLKILTRIKEAAKFVLNINIEGIKCTKQNYNDIMNSLVGIPKRYKACLKQQNVRIQPRYLVAPSYSQFRILPADVPGMAQLNYGRYDSTVYYWWP